jgi:hypothetical protein
LKWDPIERRRSLSGKRDATAARLDKQLRKVREIEEQITELQSGKHPYKGSMARAEQVEALRDAVIKANTQADRLEKLLGALEQQLLASVPVGTPRAQQASTEASNETPSSESPPVPQIEPPATSPTGGLSEAAAAELKAAFAGLIDDDTGDTTPPAAETPTPPTPPAKPGKPETTEWQKTFAKFRAALAKAQKAKDWPKVLEEVKRFKAHYNNPENGAWPDNWTAWDRAEEDATLAMKAAKTPAAETRAAPPPPPPPQTPPPKNPASHQNPTGQKAEGAEDRRSPQSLLCAWSHRAKLRRF